MIKWNGHVKGRYKFTDKSQSVGGILSTIVAIAAAILVIAGIYISYQNRGDGGRLLGLFGVSSIFLSGIGLYAGIKSFSEEDIFFLFSWLGSICNSVILIGMFLLILSAV